MKGPMAVTAVVIVALIGVGVFWLRSGPDAAQFANLKDPRLTRAPDERMLVVEAEGDPNVVGARAFKQLFSAYYRLDGISRRQTPPAPRARWPKPAGTPRRQWLGQYALPVPSAAELRAEAAPGERPASIKTWKYGEVAEVLHVGPYSTEEPDINRLLTFVASKGYRVVGDHEEQYVRGPGMFFAGDPNRYLTIIRLRVEKQ